MLLVIEIAITSVRGIELIVIAALADAVMFTHRKLIGLAKSGVAVGEHEGDAPDQELQQSVLDAHRASGTRAHRRLNANNIRGSSEAPR